MKTMMFNIRLLVIALPIAWGTMASADLLPQELLKQSDRARGRRAGIQWTVEIDSIENGRQQQRTLELKAKDRNSLARFVAPAKVKGRKVLMRDRNMWFIKPGLKKPVPISPRQKMMGGASYGDIASTNYAGDYKVAAVTDSDFEGEACHQMDLVAKNKKVTYAKIRYWVSKTRNVGLKAEFFTVSGKVFKSATFDYGNQLALDGEQVPFVSKMTITDAVTPQNITVLSYRDVQARSVPASTFNLNLLVR